MSIRNYFALFLTILVGNIASAQCEFTVRHANSNNNCLYAIEEVVWSKTGLSANITRNGFSIVKSGGSYGQNAGAVSVNQVKDNGWVTTVVNENNLERMFGLSSVDGGNAYTSIKYGFYLRADQTLEVYESGSHRKTIGSYNTNDVLKIAVENGVVKYYHNNSLQWVSAITPTLPMIVDVTLTSVNATIEQVKVYNGSDGTFTAFAPAADLGAGATYRWILNGFAVGTGSTYTNTSLSPGNTLYCELTPGAGGCSVAPVNSNTVTFQMEPASRFGNYYITHTSTDYACLEAREEAIEFTNKTNVVSSGNNLEKIYGSNFITDAGASSVAKVYNNGYVEATVDEINRGRWFGISSTDPNINANSIQFAVFLRADGVYQINESGAVPSGSPSAAYANNDVFRIAIEQGVVKYYRNGSLIWISTGSPTTPMVVDVSFTELNSTLKNIEIVNGSTGDFSAVASVTGASPTYQWTLNGANVATGSTYSNPGLSAADQVQCVITPDLLGCSVTSSVIDISTRSYGGTFYITNTPSTIACAVTAEQIMPTNKTKVTASGNTVTKVLGTSGFWDAGATSLNQIQNNGYTETTIVEINTTRMFGVSTEPVTRPLTSSSIANTTIQYAVMIAGNQQLYVYEIDGVGVQQYRGNPASYQANDVIGFKVENNIVSCYRVRAGVTTTLYTFTQAPTLPLVVDMSFNDLNATLSNIIVSNGSLGTFNAIASSAGVSPTYQWQVNGANDGANAPTYFNQNLTTNDVVICTITPDIAGCSLSQDSNSITVGIIGGAGSPTTTWSGATSTAWETSSNWSNGLPRGYTKVVIPSGRPRYPTINQAAGAYDITIQAGGTLTIAGSNSLTVFNDWSNAGTFVENTSSVTLKNCTNNTNDLISVSEIFSTLVIDNANGVAQSGTPSIKTTMTLTSGIVTSATASDFITFLDNATVTGASNASHIDGKVRKVGNDAFVFPTGDAGIYRRIAMSAPTTVTDHFTARYFKAAQAYGGPSTWQAGIWHVSGCEYWTLDRSGASTPNVTLSWDNYTGCANPPYIGNLADLLVVQWDGTNWKTLGSGGTIGDVNDGEIVNLTAPTAYLAFTLGTKNDNNVLPLELGSFTAVNTEMGVQLDWETLSEINADYFEVQRAIDNLTFEPVARVEALGNAEDPYTYQHLDRINGSGIIYYRLKMVDLDGSFEYSRIVSVERSGEGVYHVFPNPLTQGQVVKFNGMVNWVRVVSAMNNNVVYEARDVDSLDTTRLPKGVYMLCFDNGAKVRLVVL
jgi:hypothetical protein